MTEAFQKNIARVLDKMELTRTEDVIRDKSTEKAVQTQPSAASSQQRQKTSLTRYQSLTFGQWLISGLRNDRLGPVMVFSSILFAIPACIFAFGYVLYTNFVY